MPEKNGKAKPAHGIWSGTVSFGLVSIPVTLMPANRLGGPHFRTLGPDGAPLARRWACSKDGALLEDGDIAHGYEVRDGRYVIVTDEELQALEPKKSRDIQLEAFVSCDDIDPLYFERAYYLVPTGSSTKAYALLARLMERTSRAAIATFVMHEREYLVGIMARNGILRAETFRFADEVRTPEDVGLPAPRKAEPAGTTPLLREIERLAAASLDETILENEIAARVAAAARKKRDQGRDVVRAKVTTDEDEVVDLMSALRRALGSRSGGRRVSARAGPRRATNGRGKGRRGAA